MRYYKVFRKIHDRLLSSWATGKAQVEYEEGKLSVAPEWLANLGYGVTVFASLVDAVNYKKTVSGNAYSKTTPIYSVAIVGSPRGPKVIGSNYRLKDGVVSPMNSSKWPNGTFMVDGVIPMALVTDEEVKTVLTNKA